MGTTQGGACGSSFGFDANGNQTAGPGSGVNAPDDWEPVLDWEHDAYRWCDLPTALETLRWPETAQALRNLVPPG